MRKSYDSKFKSRVALEAMRGELTIAEIASKYQVHANQVQMYSVRDFGQSFADNPKSRFLFIFLRITYLCSFQYLDSY